MVFEMNRPDRKLPRIRRVILSARAKERDAFNKYSDHEISLDGIDKICKSVKLGHSQLGDAFSEYLAYWNNQQLAHIHKGTEKTKRALKND